MTPVAEYSITEELRSDAHTELCRAVRKQDKQPVLLNVLHPGPWLAAQRNRFEQDFEIGRLLDTPCVLRPHALENREAGVTLVLEDFGGQPLDQTLDRGRLGLAEAVAIALRAAEALGEIHSRGITHKDVRPANLLYDSESGQLKITGFGIATALKREASLNRSARLAKSSLAYISPEQTGRMNRSLDCRTDFYSLGVTLYQCLTGQLPFAAQDDLELVHCHLAREPMPPARIDPAIPETVAQIVMKLLAKAPEDRYQSAFGLAADLRECHHQLGRATRIEPFELGRHDRSETFRIPEKLYGRERQVSRLLQAFERTGQGKAELMLVAGYSGVGKSALINELHKPIVRQRGYFISGKCDQYQRHIPYSALSGAFDEFIRQILTETEDEIEAWRRDLLEALSPNGQVILDVIPELERIIGPQPPVTPLPPNEAQNRFDMALVKFLHVLAREDHRLVMFLDDLQWVDSSSLRLLDLLITDPDSAYFLLLGAYRDNEVDATHPLMHTLEGIRGCGATLNTVRLTPLALPDVTCLCADTLGCPASQAQELAQLVFDKTEGNPFFLRQSLEHLAEQGALAFDYGSGTWQWDTAQIHEMAITDNVVELMTKRIRELPAATRNPLKLAACIGNRFNLATLALVSDRTPAEMSQDLWEALLAETIVPLGAGPHTPVFSPETAAPKTEYRFLHDRVQEAAYSLIPAEERAQVHLRIGRALLHESSEEERENSLFDIVNHLNTGAALIEDPHERDALARLNLQAGRKAKTSTAYADARRFLMTGIGLLAPSCWHDEYELSLSLHVEAVEIQYLNTDFSEAQRLSEIVVAESKNLLDQVKVHVIRVQYLITQNRMIEALDVALPVLDMLGYPVSSDPADFKLHGTLPHVDELDSLPRITDPTQLAAAQLLTIITGPAYQGKPEVFPPICFKLVNLFQAHGLSPLAAYAYGVYAVLLCGPLNDIAEGYRAGKLSLRMLEHLPMREYECKVHFVFDSFIRHWKEPFRDTMRAYVDTVQTGLDTGDFVYVAYCRIWSSNYLLLTGHPLAYVEEQQRHYAELMTKLKQGNGLYPAKVWRQLTLSLQGVSADKHSLYGESFSEEDMRAVETLNVVTTVFAVHFSRLIQAYVYADFAAAFDHAKAAEPLEDSVIASMMSAGYVFYDALARLAAYPDMDEGERHAALARVEAHLGRVREWRRQAPANFRSKLALIEAEKARLDGRVVEAMHLYEEACNLAKKDGFPQEHAIAAERAHDFHAEQGQERFARLYIQEAYEAYCQWGAKGKAKDLEARHAGLRAPAMPDDEEEDLSPGEGSQPLLGALDVMTLLRASQALSGEIERGSLLAKLMQLAIENAGARRGLLIVNRDGDLRVEAQATNSGMQALPAVPLEESGLLPAALVRLVARTGETIVLADATADITFALDPYVAAHKPRSVLCTPISRRESVVAMIYLENELSTNVFTSERLSVLNVLLAQATISLDNAALFEKHVRAEERMRHLRNYLANIINSMPSVLVGVDTEGTVTQWNNAAQQATGVPANEAIGQPLAQVFSRLASEMDRVHEAVRTGEVQSDTGQTREQNGQTRYEEVTVYPLAGKQLEGAVIRVDDVTLRKQAEEEIRKFKTIFDNANYGSAIANVKGDLEYVNGYFADIHGYSSEELIGRNISVFHNEEQMRVVSQIIASMKDEGRFGPIDVWHTHRNGTAFPMLMTGMLMNDAQGRPAFMATTAIDITHEVELEAQLRQAQKMEAVGQLAGGVAHDFNNLLQAILGYGDLALDEAGPGNPIRASIEEMLKAGHRAKTLVSQLLAFSRRQVLEMKDVNLNDVIADLMKMIRRVIGEHITLDIRAGHGLGIVRADPGQIEQILMNLCVNARDAMPGGGTITIETDNVKVDEVFCETHSWAEAGSYALLRVSDTGCGIDNDTLTQVFEPFFTTKEPGQGTGLGLSTVYGLVKQHEGLIHVQSEIGNGTAFSIYLPLIDPSAISAATKPKGPVAGGTETILLAEDDAIVQRLSQVFLERAGYTVLIANDGEEALRVFEEHANTIDLALLDVMMPKLGGHAVFEHIKEKNPQVRVLFASGYSMNAIHTGFVLDKGLALIQKPCLRDDLLRKVREVLDEA